jgi:glycogen debranching enzyme
VSPAEGGSYYAIALDGGDQVVDGLTSNMGHLLGTGTLDHAQSAEVARHLVSDELFSGWGVRTRGLHHARYNPFSYHGGAVWAHDTAIAIRGLATAAQDAFKAGDPDSAQECAAAARKLAKGLLRAAQQFEYRLPELCSGDGNGDDGATVPSPFPAACRPQAWSAAAGIAVLDALRRIESLPSSPR